MTFVDANYFLRALVRPAMPADEASQRVAIALFRAVERGEEEITTSEAVLAEVAFLLASPRHYRLSAGEAADRLRPILELRGCKLPEKRLSLHALDLWATTPHLGFVDALTAAYVMGQGLRLASFDADFDRFPEIERASQDAAA